MVSLAIDPTSAAWHEDPYPSLAHAREHTPVVFQPETGSWAVFRYRDCHEILRDPDRFSSDYAHAAPPRRPRLITSILTADPPRHTRLRDLVSRAFGPREVAALEPRAREIARALIHAVAPSGRVDLIDDLAIPLPVLMIADILGVPREDQGRFRAWSDAVIIAQGTGGVLRGAARAEEALAELDEYFGAVIADRRRSPRADVISALVGAEIDGERLDTDEIVAFCNLLLVGGNETTTNLIGNAMRCFLEMPRDLARVRAAPALLPSALEEVLRWRSPVHTVGRIPRRDVTLHGRLVRAGEPLVLWLSAANRDPEQFPDPDRFDLTRDPNRHLAFGHGVHFCLGAPLARLEARVAFEELLARFPRITRAATGPYDPVPGYVMQGVRHLPLCVGGGA